MSTRLTCGCAVLLMASPAWVQQYMYQVYTGIYTVYNDTSL
jgi:hypothetical protein